MEEESKNRERTEVETGEEEGKNHLFPQRGRNGWTHDDVKTDKGRCRSHIGTGDTEDSGGPTPGEYEGTHREEMVVPYEYRVGNKLDRGDGLKTQGSGHREEIQVEFEGPRGTVRGWTPSTGSRGPCLPTYGGSRVGPRTVHWGLVPTGLGPGPTYLVPGSRLDLSGQRLTPTLSVTVYASPRVRGTRRGSGDRGGVTWSATHSGAPSGQQQGSNVSFFDPTYLPFLLRVQVRL